MNNIFKQCLLLITGMVILLPSLGASAATNTCSSVTYPSASTAGNDIVFKFDKEYQCGQFANGDYWVTPYPEFSLKIISITPDSANGLNGYEVNPSSKTAQALDNRMNGYTPALQPALPLILAGDVSLVKAVSVPAGTTNCFSANRPCLQHAAVLTVTVNPVLDSGNKFRPGYFGKTKTFYSTANISSKSFTKFPVTCCSESQKLTFPMIKSRYQRVQLDHIAGWVGRSLHPLDNMPDYGAIMASDNAVVLLRMMMSDFALSNPDAKAALINYLQMAVDLQSMAANGATWVPDGGHTNGRKLPLVFAGWLLGDPSFQSSIKTSIFSEDKQVYFSTRANMALYGRDCGSTDAYWKTTVSGSGSRDCRDPYGLIDGGGKEIGAAYQVCCTAKPWKNTALVIKALGLQTLWNNDAFIQYVDRWVKSGVKALPDVCAAYDGTATNYTKTYGSPTLTSDCVVGKGRWPTMNGTNKNGGLYGHPLAEQLWTFMGY